MGLKFLPKDYLWLPHDSQPKKTFFFQNYPQYSTSTTTESPQKHCLAGYLHQLVEIESQLVGKKSTITTKP
jgi:hypothetical protein